MERRTTDAAGAPSRRGLLASAAAVALAGAVGGLAGGPSSGPVPAAGGGGAVPVRRLADGRGGEGAGFALAERPAVLQLVAHPDDDLFFMNPDLVQDLTAGIPVTSVYVTDGGSFGRNAIPGGPPPEPNVPAYVSARQQGLRQAYARMLGAPLFTAWERSALPLPGGRLAEVNRLAHGGRRAELIFLDLRMHARNGRAAVNLTRLWDSPGVTLPTQPAPESPVRRSFPYTRGDLVDTLVHLLAHVRPTLVRTLDPDPDAQVHDRHHPRDSDQPGYSDHPDHTAAGLFAWAALARWGGRGGPGARTPAFRTEAYRGYYNQRWPYNLPPATVALKARYLDAYGGDPGWQCGNPSGCGDYALGGAAALASRKGWVRSTHRRHPGAGPRALAGPDGRVSVYAVLGTRLARWRPAAKGAAGSGPGAFGPPEDLGGGPLAPALSVVRAPDGRHLVLGLRSSSPDGAAGRDAREVVLLRQRTPGGAFETEWIGLGNPETEPRRTRLTGPPTAVTGADGRVHVFVRNGDKGVSTRVLGTDGVWSAWRALPGGGIQEGLAATVDGRGLVHLFGAAAERVEHWAQRTPGGALHPAARPPAGRPGDVPEAVTAPDGSVLLAYRRAASDTVAVARLAPGRGRRWTALGSPSIPGYGRVAVAPADGGTLLVPAGTATPSAYDLTGARTTPAGASSSAAPAGTPFLLAPRAGAPVAVTLTPLGTPLLTPLRPTTPA
ncbi:PIG-L family deacetylase [Streptomyces sp. NPDC035033]|uniref:PIG-L family deacetylase n=1 Tax=Streptomyces sp. NPDC035033 TaxID=3155368 RepID=UPI0033C7A57B